MCDCCPYEKEKYCCLGCYAWSENWRGEESCICWGLGGINKYAEREKAGIGLWCCLGPFLLMVSKTIDIFPNPPKITKTVELCTACTYITYKKEDNQVKIDVKSPCCGFQKVVNISTNTVSGAPKESATLTDPLNSVD